MTGRLAIEALAAVLTFSDAELAPFYDVRFSPDLDLGRTRLFDKPIIKPIIDGIRAKPESRAEWIRRAEEYQEQR